MWHMHKNNVLGYVVLWGYLNCQLCWATFSPLILSHGGCPVMGTRCKLTFWNFLENLILMHIQKTCKIFLFWNGHMLSIALRAGIVQLWQLVQNIVNANTSDPRITWIYNFSGWSLSQGTGRWLLAQRHWDPFQINPCYWHHLALNKELSSFPVVSSLVRGKSYLAPTINSWEW